MSWQAASFGLLALALAGGFGWYERARPDARVVALVGTLAAFAALGRIAFAAVPNVKPTTDIVLIAGYALGGGPGFAVGALAGLTSNFFFGQGPWTPWQMAAWGATGIIGAGLARLVAVRSGRPARPLGRWPLALVCCVVGFGFTVVQDVGDWVTYSGHSLGQLGVYVGQGLGFDAVHAAGCLGFALAIGPALTRSIQRYALRLSVTWVGSAAPLMALALAGGALVAHPSPALAGSAAAAHRAPTRAAAGTSGVVARARSYLLGAENRDGGFGPAPGQPSQSLYTGWAALGLAAAGVDVERVSHGGAALIANVQRESRPGSDIGSVERTILVDAAAGLPARADAGLVAALRRHVGRDGSIDRQVNLTTFGVLALRAVHAGPPAQMLGWLVAQQDRDGGFNYAVAGGASDVDDTGAALEALAGDAAAGAGTARARAVNYLRHVQDADGGFPSQPGTGSNAQSTSWAIQGLVAAGVPPAGVRRNGRSPLDYLVSLAAPGGAIRYSRGVTQTPVWVTGEALMALVQRPLPLAPRPRPAASGGVTGSSASTAPAGVLALIIRFDAPEPVLTGLGLLARLALAPVGPG